MPVDDAAATAAIADQRTALDPGTDAQVLAAIAQHRPDLRAAVAMNPATYPALLEWLGDLDDPVVTAALAARTRTTLAAPPPAVPVPPTPAAGHATPEPDTTAPTVETTPRTKRRTGLLIGTIAAILILAGGGYLATQLLSNPQPAATSGAADPTAPPSSVASAANVESTTPAEAKAAVIRMILVSSERRIEGTPTAPVTILSRDEELAFAVVWDGEAQFGTAATPLAPVDAEVNGNQVTAVDGWDVLTLPQIQDRKYEVLALRVSLSEDPMEGRLRTDNGTLVYVARSTIIYDEVADTLTDEQGKVFRTVCAYQMCGYQAEDGTELGPVWAEGRPSAGQAPGPGTYPIRVLSSDGSQANDGPSGRSTALSISADGRYVAFASAASNLVPGDTNGAEDVFLFDRDTETTTRVSVSADGTQADADSHGPALSEDGRWIAFTSQAPDLVPGDTTEGGVFLWDRVSGTTTRVAASGGFVDISADGRYTVYLQQGGSSGVDDVFLFDRDTETTTRLSDGTGRSGTPAISANGRYVVYDSNLWDRETGTTTEVPVYGLSKDISADGRYIVYDSFSSELVPADTNGIDDVFLWDRDTGTTTRVSVATDGTQAIASNPKGSGDPAISADGRWITYSSVATNLVPGDVNRTWDLFLWDRDTETTTRVSVATDGTQGDSRSGPAAVSADGRWITFISEASNLVPGDTNGADVFLTPNPQFR